MEKGFIDVCDWQISTIKCMQPSSVSLAKVQFAFPLVLSIRASGWRKWNLTDRPTSPRNARGGNKKEKRKPGLWKKVGVCYKESKSIFKLSGRKEGSFADASAATLCPMAKWQLIFSLAGCSSYPSRRCCDYLWRKSAVEATPPTYE